MKLKQLWESQDCKINGWLSIANSFTAEIVARADWDSITIDAQHGMLGLSDSISMLQAIKACGKPAMVRVPWLREESIMSYLDAGAMGLICPMINTADDAEKFVNFSSYPPRGNRSFGPTRALFSEGDNYFHHINNDILRLAMIETVEAVENMDKIIQTKGIDGIYIGPSDLAVSFGYPPGFDRTENQLIDTIKKIITQCHQHNKKVALHTGSADYAKKSMAWGVNLVTVSNDVRLLSSAVLSTIKQLKG